MVTFLMGYMSQRAARLVSFLVVPLVVLGLFYWALDSYGDRRYSDGQQAEQAAWRAAQDKLLRQAANAATTADKAALAAAIEHAAVVEDEKEKVDEAIANGTSPLDVLFPSSVR